MPIEIFLVMLIGAIVFPFALWIRFLHENGKKTPQSALVVVFRDFIRERFCLISSSRSFRWQLRYAWEFPRFNSRQQFKAWQQRSRQWNFGNGILRTLKETWQRYINCTRNATEMNTNISNNFLIFYSVHGHCSCLLNVLRYIRHWQAVTCFQCIIQHL